MTDPTQCPAGNSVTQMELCCGNYTTMNHFTQNIIQQTGDRVKGILSTTAKYIAGETYKTHCKVHAKKTVSSSVLIFLNPLHPKSALLDFTLSDARRFHSSK